MKSWITLDNESFLWQWAYGSYNLFYIYQILTTFKKGEIMSVDVNENCKMLKLFTGIINMWQRRQQS